VSIFKIKLIQIQICKFEFSGAKLSKTLKKLFITTCAATRFRARGAADE
jgi:hypothetical protein